MNQTRNKNRLFRRFSAVTIIAVYLLIAVGGIVRSTGSGMGCPDWPKCFGSWVPPTDVSQLPDDYKAEYVQQRVEKNEKFGRYLTSLGFADLANQVANDPSILEEEDFNAVKTWTEYINRLVGAVIGILIFGTFVLSLRYWREDKLVTVLSFLAVILVGFQAWIGSIVVSTNLLQWMITIHMLLALVIVCLLIYVYYRSKRDFNGAQVNLSKKLKALIVVCLALSTIQVVLGTQVREAIDQVADSFARSEWIENVGSGFKIHRTYSLLILAVHIWMIRVLIKESKNQKSLVLPTQVLLAVVAVEIVSGALMAYFGVPAFIQPIHLLLGTGIIGLQYYVLLLTNNRKIVVA